MNTRILLNIVLAAIVIFLALILFYEPGTKKPEPALSPLTSVNPDQVQAIRVVHNKPHEEIHLERKEEKWFLTTPIHAPANTSIVETLLSIAETPSYSHYPAQGLDLVKLGLKPPKVRLYLDNLAIDFGMTAPLNQRRYVLLEDTVHLINDAAFHTITSGAPKFVNPALLPGNYPITELRLPLVTISGGNPNVDVKHTITLRQDKGQWIAEGIDNPPSSEAIAKLVEAWQQYTTQQIDLKENKPVLATIEIQRKGASPVHLELLSALPQLVLARSDFGVQYNLPAPAWKTLFQLPQDDGNNKKSLGNSDKKLQDTIRNKQPDK
jgi:hypothetical protein